jgi:predicted phage tail protein
VIAKGATNEVRQKAMEAAAFMAGSGFRHILWRVCAVPGMIHQGGAAFLCAGIAQAIAAIGSGTQSCRSDEEAAKTIMHERCSEYSTNLLTASAA